MDTAPPDLPPRLKVLVDQLAKLPVLLEHEFLSHLQQAQESQAISNAPAISEHEVMQLRQQAQDAKRELELLKLEHQSIVEDKRKWDEAVASASQQHQKINTEMSSAVIRLQRLEQARQSIESRQAQLEESHAQMERDKVALAAREADAAQRDEHAAQLSARYEGTRRWLESLLPGWLGEETITPWRDALMEDAQQPGSSSTAAGLLFATLSLYTYAQRDTDARAVADALREVGRRLYAWIKERGHDDQLAAEVAQSWAEAINRECTGRCEVEVPVPGSPASNQTMNFRPRPGVSAQTVATVQFWCVRGAKREVIHRSEVTV